LPVHFWQREGWTHLKAAMGLAPVRQSWMQHVRLNPLGPPSLAAAHSGLWDPAWQSMPCARSRIVHAPITRKPVQRELRLQVRPVDDASSCAWRQGRRGHAACVKPGSPHAPFVPQGPKRVLGADLHPALTQDGGEQPAMLTRLLHVYSMLRKAQDAGAPGPRRPGLRCDTCAEWFGFRGPAPTP
jgi:hypothetical protein